jgi:hypothetical protein
MSQTVKTASMKFYKLVEQVINDEPSIIAVPDAKPFAI